VTSNIERLRSLFARFNESGELDFSLTDPEIELHSRPDVAYGAASGAPVEIDEAQLWTFRDGLLIRIQGFPTVEEAYSTADELDRQP
jgi:hypothetical protein